MSKHEQLKMLVDAMISTPKNGKAPYLTEEGISTLQKLLESEGRGFLVDFRSTNINENVV